MGKEDKGRKKNETIMAKKTELQGKKRKEEGLEMEGRRK